MSQEQRGDYFPATRSVPSLYVTLYRDHSSPPTSTITTIHDGSDTCAGLSEFPHSYLPIMLRLIAVSFPKYVVPLWSPSTRLVLTVRRPSDTEYRGLYALSGRSSLSAGNGKRQWIQWLCSHVACIVFHRKRRGRTTVYASLTWVVGHLPLVVSAPHHFQLHYLVPSLRSIDYRVQMSVCTQLRHRSIELTDESNSLS